MYRFAAILTLLTLFLITSPTSSRATELTAEDIVINQGNAGQIEIRWTSTTSLSYLSTQLQIVPVAGPTGGPAGGVTFTQTNGEAPVPPMTDASYVFFGDSTQQSLYIDSGISPATVTTTVWTDDTYNFLDDSFTGDPYTQNGTRLWTVLNIQAGALVEGAYRIALAAGEYNGPPGITPTFSGGLITVVPEPSAMTFSAIGTLAVLLRIARSRIRNGK